MAWQTAFTSRGLNMFEQEPIVSTGKTTRKNDMATHKRRKDMKTIENILERRGKNKRGRATLGVASNQMAVQVLSWSRQSPTNLSDLCANVPSLWNLEIACMAVDRDENNQND